MHLASRFFVFYTKQKINLTWPYYTLYTFEYLIVEI